MQLFMAVGRYGPVKTSVDEKSNPSNLFKTFYFSIKSIPARHRCSMICDSVDNQYSADFAFSLSCHRFLLCHINIIIYRLKFTSQSSKKQYYLFLFFSMYCTHCYGGERHTGACIRQPMNWRSAAVPSINHPEEVKSKSLKSCQLVFIKN